MKRMSWMTEVLFSLGIIVMHAGGAWAGGPTGAANLPQISRGQTLVGNLTSTALTNQGILFRAEYYDPAPACDGVAPTFVQLFLFTQEGDFVGQFDGSSDAESAPELSKFRSLTKSFGSISSIPLAPDSYKWTFLVRDCTNATSVVLPELLTLRVFAP